MTDFSNRILHWYSEHARVLPWRGISDPYAVWVSEIMLQQTRVDTVIPYYFHWMKVFPDIETLAAASEQSVLSAWEGLGYYSRARNLHKAAQMISADFDGELPSDISDLRKLPGIGRYTAGALASMAFNQDQPTLDGNIRRVITRVFDVSTPADTPAGEKILWELAAAHMPKGQAGDFNQALMDFGSAVCTPKKPDCDHCPVCDICQSSTSPENRPVLKQKASIPHRVKWAAVIVQSGKTLVFLRPSKGLLGGMWEFPAVEMDDISLESFIQAIHSIYGLTISPKVILKTIEHAYSHFTLTEIAWNCDLLDGVENLALEWVDCTHLEKFPMGKVDRAIATKISQSGDEQK